MTKTYTTGSVVNDIADVAEVMHGENDPTKNLASNTAIVRTVSSTSTKTMVIEGSGTSVEEFEKELYRAVRKNSMTDAGPQVLQISSTCIDNGIQTKRSSRLEIKKFNVTGVESIEMPSLLKSTSFWSWTERSHRKASKKVKE